MSCCGALECIRMHRSRIQHAVGHGRSHRAADGGSHHKDRDERWMKDRDHRKGIVAAIPSRGKRSGSSLPLGVVAQRSRAPDS